ncbi:MULTISPECIES: maleylpyruvate isomerase family mycothiol-dependent enzyme [Pseudofrankia]|uniref:maleylpyruvate isomerase family mycothiol-dependent enzyme n=1 Tax=Pseudofrankia TaxID=2994363 RepID=UPI000234D8A7|nr:MULTISPECIES: maleylpyruvate isomerase family mycothiol-dependent enzyme [Pseudofrankia]OHV30912.1 hypothetical protein BCD49_33115 [Pseudofrankia sp. EUN1h]
MSSDTSPAGGLTTFDTEPLERALTESLDVFSGLTADEMEAPSACDGWTVRTTLAHLTAGVAAITGQLPAVPYDKNKEFEAAVDAQALDLAARPAAELLEILRSASPALVNIFASLPDDFAAMPVDMGTAGTYPFASLADALTFDHTCHVRWDVLTPRGQVRRTLPDLDAGRLSASLRWLTGCIPQMTTERFRDLLTDPLTFILTGPGAATFRLTPHAASVETSTDEPTRATVKSTTSDFILWGTGRESRQGRVKITGDVAYAERALDAFRVY